MQQIQWVVESAASHRWRQAFTFLPELLSSPSLPDTIFFAYSKHDPQNIVGAAAAVPLIKDVHYPGFHAMVRVHEAYRRQGIGRMLIQHVQQYIATWDVPYMHGWKAYADGVEKQFLLGCGFHPNLNVYTFEAVREEAIHLLNILDKYSMRGRLNAAYTFTPIDTNELMSEAKLYSEHFQITYNFAQQSLKSYLALPNAQTLSASLYLDEKLQGFLIGYVDSDKVPKVEFWVTQKQLTNTPTAMLLLCNFAKQFYEQGFPKGRFECNDHARTTLNLLKRLNVVEIARHQSFVLPTDSERH